MIKHVISINPTYVVVLINTRKHRHLFYLKFFIVIMLLKFSFLLLFFIVINADEYELDYLFPSMIFEPALKLIPQYQKGIYSYSFIVPPASKIYGPHVAFYLFAGQPTSKTAEIVINQDGKFFQTLSDKQYWQSNKIPMPLTMNETTVDLYIRDGDNVGPTYTIHVTRASE